jgi:hypothetical protein
MPPSLPLKPSSQSFDAHCPLSHSIVAMPAKRPLKRPPALLSLQMTYTRFLRIALLPGRRPAMHIFIRPQGLLFNHTVDSFASISPLRSAMPSLPNVQLTFPSLFCACRGGRAARLQVHVIYQIHGSPSPTATDPLAACGTDDTLLELADIRVSFFRGPSIASQAARVARASYKLSALEARRPLYCGTPPRAPDTPDAGLPTISWITSLTHLSRTWTMSHHTLHACPLLANPHLIDRRRNRPARVSTSRSGVTVSWADTSLRSRRRHSSSMYQLAPCMSFTPVLVLHSPVEHLTPSRRARTTSTHSRLHGRILAVADQRSPAGPVVAPIASHPPSSRALVVAFICSEHHHHPRLAPCIVSSFIDLFPALFHVSSP